MDDRPGDGAGRAQRVAAAGTGAADRLRELAHRLREVHRRTAPRGEGQAAVELARRRLADLVEGVETCLLSDLPGPSPAELEVQLAAVEQLFEGSGDPKTARVLEGVRESLTRPAAAAEDAEPPPPRRFEPPAPRRSDAPSGRYRRWRSDDEADDLRDRDRETRRTSRWWLALAAVGALAVAVVLLQRTAGESAGVAVPAPEVVAADRGGGRPAGVSRPSPEPTRSWSSLEDEAVDYETRLEQVKVEVAEGWKAIRAADVDAAVERLAAAAALDRHHRMVRELGRGVVEALVTAADAAASDGRWREASEGQARARALVEALSLDPAPVEAGDQRLAAMRRFDALQPGDRRAIAGAVGREVRVTVAGAAAVDGRLTAFSGDMLSLAVESGVPGGEVAFTTEVPLARVVELRVYHDPPAP